ncbi:hypothetical protein AB434_3320 [Heyndrickxia coagulans]|uniref:Uncharacterized protein n=1 Tax=Heyndrickxia coagulans TaxID=1398 RepID=A0AAN0T6K1_HEYCO|nr:hypothetical protein SB48_HM08orf03110 [Heyndrickxia coagulans]AKN55725.1 hypothetical protein AB434_3320 [Heyndrickxia coagulans]KYC63991.1 hypothetical protein B4100_3125 [Heyndrickxia coagulans]KYC87210.1 hypothetical protein B4096_3122 [Heyndrickxia coagulans]
MDEIRSSFIDFRPLHTDLTLSYAEGERWFMMAACCFRS